MHVHNCAYASEALYADCAKFGSLNAYGTPHVTLANEFSHTQFVHFLFKPNASSLGSVTITCSHSTDQVV